MWHYCFTAGKARLNRRHALARIAVQPFTDRGLKLPDAHVITHSRKVSAAR